MSTDSLYSLAIEMLRSTSVYRKELEEFHYPSLEDEDEDVRLVDIVRYRANRLIKRRKADNNEKQLAYQTVSESLAEYIENFPAVFSFKQNTKEKFTMWLEKIAVQYEIEGAKIPDILKIQQNEKDTAIVMLKSLHERKGVSKEELTRKLGINHLRSIQKNLRKLSPGLYEGPDIEKDNVYTPFRIGGQPVIADIRERGVNNKNQKLYNTPNTIHPIILQENLMQAGALLQALSRNFNEHCSEISVQIATDIWSQLSDYAKKRVEKVYAARDTDFADFINMLKDVCPNYRVCTFRTERQMASEIDLQLDEALRFLEKAPERYGTITYDDEYGEERCLEKQQIRRIYYDGNNEKYVFVSVNGREHIIDYADIKDVLIEP